MIVKIREFPLDEQNILDSIHPSGDKSQERWRLQSDRRTQRGEGSMATSDFVRGLQLHNSLSIASSSSFTSASRCWAAAPNPVSAQAIALAGFSCNHIRSIPALVESHRSLSPINLSLISIGCVQPATALRNSSPGPCRQCRPFSKARHTGSHTFVPRASGRTKLSETESDRGASDKDAKESEATSGEGQDEEEVEISWIQEKAEDAMIATGQAIQAVPGPRVGGGHLPWLVALPLGYFGITLVIAVVKTIRKYNSPKGQRKRQVGKNAYLCESLGEYLPNRREELDSKKLRELEQKCQFDTKELLRKYIRYALNERPFNPDLVADLIHLRKVSSLPENDVAEVLNEVSRRIVKSKGTVVMNLQGFTEKGIKRKASVQALFSKILYLSELDEFVSSESRSSLTIKTTFGVTDEDADSIRIDTLSEASDMESLEKMVGSAESESDAEEADTASSS